MTTLYTGELAITTVPTNELYVATNGNDTTGDGTYVNPFLTIQKTIDYAVITYPSRSFNNPVIITVASGEYREQIHSYIHIVIQSSAAAYDTVQGQAKAMIINVGDDPSNYPLRTNAGDVYYLIGIAFETDTTDGVVGRLPEGTFKNCSTWNGHFISNPEQTNSQFKDCKFDNDTYGGFNIGSDVIANINSIFLDRCIFFGKPTFKSTYPNSAHFGKVTSTWSHVFGSLDIGGDWEMAAFTLKTEGSVRNNFSTSSEVKFQYGYQTNGVHFSSAPSKTEFINVAFKSIIESTIPTGEADITADVAITCETFTGNTVANGLGGKIIIPQKSKSIGFATDSYIDIYAAIESITDASETSPYVVVFNAGTYVLTSTVTLPDFVSIRGAGISSTIIDGNNGAFDIFVLAQVGSIGANNGISFLTIQNSGTGYAGINADNVGVFGMLHKVTFYNCDIGVQYKASTIDSEFYLEYVDFDGEYTRAINIKSENGFEAFLNAENTYVYGNSGTTTNEIKVDGATARFSCYSGTIQGNLTDTAILITNGAKCSLKGVGIKSVALGVHVDTNGTNPSLFMSGIVFGSDCTQCLNIANSTASGFYVGYVPYLKSSINTDNSFFITNRDDHIITVAKKGGDFTDISGAIDAIEAIGTAEDNQFIISVGPGIFNSPILEIPDYVSLIGAGINATILRGEAPTAASYDGLIAVEGGGTATLTVVCDTPGIIGDKIITGDAINTCSGLIGAGYTITEGADVMLANTVEVSITGGDEGGNDHHLVDMGNTSEISFLTLQNAESGYAALTTTRALDEYWQAHKVSIYNCDIGILVDATTFDSEVYLEYVDVDEDYTSSIKVVSASGFEAYLSVENYYSYPVTTNTGTDIIVDGEGSQLTMSSCGIEGAEVKKGIVVTNGGHFDCKSTTFLNYTTAIHADTNGTNPILHLTSLNFENCTQNLNIENTTATGRYAGYSEYSKNSIASDNSFFITFKDANIITVYIKGGDFDDIETAVASITDAAIDNPHIIDLGPGIFECNLVLKQHVYVQGQSGKASILQAKVNTLPVMYASPNSGIQGCSITGSSGTDGAGILYNESCPVATLGSSAFVVKECSFSTNETNIKVYAGTVSRTMLVDNCSFSVISKYGFHITGETGIFAILGFSNSQMSIVNSSSTSTLLYADGDGVNCLFSSIRAQCVNSTGIGAHLRNGATFESSSCGLVTFHTGIWAENNGTGPDISGSLTLRNSTYDILVEHPDTTGSITGSIDVNKVTINSSATISMAYADHGTVGQVVLESLYQGDRHDRLINFSKLVRRGTSMGLYEGGELSRNVTSLNLDVASGGGFLIDPTDSFVKEVTWDADTLTIPASTDVYISVNTNGVVIQSGASPDLEDAVVLGRVAAGDSAIDFIERSSMNINQLGNEQEEMFRDALGCIYSTGSLVSENSTTAFNLDVTSGRYYFGSKMFEPSGGTGISFDIYYKDSPSGWIDIDDQTAVNSTQYDNGSGTLQSLTSGYFAKHSLYLVEEGSEEKYYIVVAQAEYSTAVAAQGAALPIPPTFFKDGVTIIADIIIEEGASTINQITDQRPRIGFKPSSVSSTSSHGDLSGLTADDHPQYLLIAGTRAMTGNLDMGGQNVTSVNLVDGVDVSAHASRHLPNGLDSLTTAAPSSVGLANAVGTDNSFSRSDHIHNIINLTHTSESPRTTTTATTLNGTQTLNVASTVVQYITGTQAGYSVALPVATTLTNGWKYEIYNTSSQPITVKYTSGATLGVVDAESIGYVILQSKATSDGTWIFFQKVTSADNIPCVQVTRTTDYTITSSYADINFDATDIETAGNLEHNDTNTNRIDIKQGGRFYVEYNFPLSPTSSGRFDFRVRKNDTTVVPRSETWSSDGGDIIGTSFAFICDLATGDFISLQGKLDGGAANVKAPASFKVIQLTGVQGEAGLTGATGPSGGPPGVTGLIGVTGPAGSAASFGENHKEESKTTTDSTTSESPQLRQSMSTGTIPAGKYRIGWFYQWRYSGGSNNFKAQIEIDDTTQAMYQEEEAKDYQSDIRYNDSGFYYATFASSGNHTIDLDYWGEGNTAYMYNSRLDIWRIS